MSTASLGTHISTLANLSAPKSRRRVRALLGMGEDEHIRPTDLVEAQLRARVNERAEARKVADEKRKKASSGAVQ